MTTTFRLRNVVAAAVFALALALGTVGKAHSLGSPDFHVFYTAARHAIQDPENIYRLSPDRYLYPPSTAILLTPFALTENFALHQWLWHALLACTLCALTAPSFAALAAFALLTRYLIITFSYGQINLPIVLLLALTGGATARGRLRAAGPLWALAASLKIYPLALGPLFLPRPRWRALGGALLAFAFLFALPFALYGLDRGSGLYADFLTALRAKGLPLHSHNQSLSAFFLRVFTKQEFYLHAVGPTHWGLLDLPEGACHALALVAGVGLAGASWWRAWRRGLASEAALSAGAFSILFLSHIVWKDYLLFLYFPLLELFSAWPRKRSLWLAGAFLAIVTLSSPDVLGAPLSTRMDAACVHLWAALLVWVAWCRLP